METNNNELLLEHINEYIPCVFQKETLFLANLRGFMTFPMYEWFNIVSILYQRENATCVETVKNYSKIIKEEAFPIKGEKGIALFSPFIENDKRLKWKIIKAFDISQMQIQECNKRTNQYDKMIENIENQNLNNCIENWLCETIKNYALTFSTDTESSQYLYQCGLRCYSISQENAKDFTLLKVPSKYKKDTIPFYKLICDFVRSIPNYIKIQIDTFIFNDNKKMRVKEVLSTMELSIEEQITRAKKILEERQKQKEGIDSKSYETLNETDVYGGDEND